MGRSKTKRDKQTGSSYTTTKAITSEIRKWISNGEEISLFRLVEEFGAENFSKATKITKTIYQHTTPNWGVPPPPGERLKRLEKIKEKRRKQLAKQSPPITDSDAQETEDEVYEVEGIVKRKRQQGKWLYLVKWKGYDDAQNTWEPVENLSSCRELLEEFLKKCTTVQRF